MEILSATTENMKLFGIENKTEWNKMCFSKKKALEVLKDKQGTFLFNHVCNLSADDETPVIYNEAFNETANIFDMFAIQNGEIVETSLICKYVKEKFKDELEDRAKVGFLTYSITMGMRENYQEFIEWIDQNYPNAQKFTRDAQTELLNDKGIHIESTYYKDKGLPLYEHEFTDDELRVLENELKETNVAFVIASQYMFYGKTFVNGVESDKNIVLDEFEAYLKEEGALSEDQNLPKKSKAAIVIESLFFDWLINFKPEYIYVEFI